MQRSVVMEALPIKGSTRVISGCERLQRYTMIPGTGKTKNVMKAIKQSYYGDLVLLLIVPLRSQEPATRN